MNSSNFSIVSMMREDDGKEARVEEAHVKTKEELEGEEVREETCRPTAAVGHDGVARGGRGSDQRSR